MLNCFMENYQASVIPKLSEKTLILIENRFKVNGILSDEDLLNLHSIFGAVLERALDILEKYPTLSSYRLPDLSRTLIEVKGETDRCYRLFPYVNYCSCPAFHFHVLQSRSQVTCKHVLAARLATITNRLLVQTVNKQQYLMLVQSVFDIGKGV